MKCFNLRSIVLVSGGILLSSCAGSVSQEWFTNMNPAAGQQLALKVTPLNVTTQWQELDTNWGGTTNSQGYLLVRSPGSAVSWAPTNGQTYTAGQTVGGTQVVVAVGSSTSVSDTSLTNGTSYYYQIFSYNSSHQYTAGATASGAPGITCPTNYVGVGPNTDVGVTSAFCVAKYEMKNDGSNNAVSESANQPWTNISRDDGGGSPVGPGAITRCQNIGTGYDLISNAQWQAVAREIEATSANWSAVTNPDGTFLNMGNSSGNYPGASPWGSGIAAGTDTAPCSGMALYPNCADNTSTDFTQKRTHTLASGSVIWDFAGNAYEWVKDNIAAGPPYEGGNNYISQQPWTSGLNHPEMWGPKNNYTALNSGQYGGLGYGDLGFSAGAVIRGGYWYGGPLSGVFTALLSYGPSNSVIRFGFRCVFVP